MEKNQAIIPLILMCFLVCSQTSADDIIGVKQGDWVLYDIVVDEASVESDVFGISWLMEIREIRDMTMTIKGCTEFSNESKKCHTQSFELRTGELPLLIPIDSEVGDVLWTIDYPNYSIDVNITGKDERKYAGVNREVVLLELVYLNKTIFTCVWDKITGVLLEMDMDEDFFSPLDNPIGHTRIFAYDTNLWEESEIKESTEQENGISGFPVQTLIVGLFLFVYMRAR